MVAVECTLERCPPFGGCRALQVALCGFLETTDQLGSRPDIPLTELADSIKLLGGTQPPGAICTLTELLLLMRVSLANKSDGKASPATLKEAALTRVDTVNSATTQSCVEAEQIQEEVLVKSEFCSAINEIQQCWV
ncbi:hypothetical protein CB1_000902012 [Camelus ferus]|nr:hypothetical protein CB1_000902012 [Camelus ferus]